MANRMFARRLPFALSLVAMLVAAEPLTTMALAEAPLDALENDRTGLVIDASAPDDGIVENMSLGRRKRRHLEDEEARETVSPTIESSLSTSLFNDEVEGPEIDSGNFTSDGVGDAEQNDEASPEEVVNDENKGNAESESTDIIDPQEESENSETKEETNADDTNDFEDIKSDEEVDRDKAQDEATSVSPSMQSSLKEEANKSSDTESQDSPSEDSDPTDPTESQDNQPSEDQNAEDPEDISNDNDADADTGDATDNENGEEENDEKDEAAIPVEPKPEEQEEKPQQQEGDEKKTAEELKWEKDDEGNGGSLFFGFVLSIGLFVVCVKHREKIATLVRSAGASGSGGNVFGGGLGGISATKYEQVSASEDPNDEEWGWGESDDNISDQNDNDDWGDNDDWDDDVGTSNNKSIEMTTPSFSSNKAHRSTNPSPVTKSLSLDVMRTSGGTNRGTIGMSNLGGSNGFGSSSQTARTLSMGSSAASSTMSTTAMSTNKTPGTQLGMAMGITSLGTKKKPIVAAKPKKKNLLGASDDDLFASMGFGGPPSATKPKTTPLPSKFASGSGSRWAAQPTPTPIVKHPTVTTPKTLASSTLGITAATAVVAPVARDSAPALIPDGFGDDNDLNLDDDDLGDTGDAGRGGGDDWGDDDGDLDDLLDL